MAADITISPFTTTVINDVPTALDIQLRHVTQAVQVIQGGSGGGSNRPVSGLVYPRLVG